MKNKTTPGKRLDLLDLVRGFAIALMFIYHFAYDLNYFGFIQQDFNKDIFWLSFRTIIVSLFLFISGISLYLAMHNRRLKRKSYLKRLCLLVTYAALVSLGSWLVFPQAWIFFGILHFIAVASVLGLCFINKGVFNLLLGLILIFIGVYYSHPVFDHAYLQWFGLVTSLPITVDYVPLLPWFGVYLVGMYAGQFIKQVPGKHWLWQWQGNNAVAKLLRFGGQHSIHIYILHQPVFIAVLASLAYLIG